VVVVVADDGRGGVDVNAGSGLRGLQDRLAAVDGTLSIDSPSERGTRLEARIPAPPERTPEPAPPEEAVA
jgi:signal transduction histidine kinase